RMSARTRSDEDGELLVEPNVVDPEVEHRLCDDADLDGVELLRIEGARAETEVTLAHPREVELVQLPLRGGGQEGAAEAVEAVVRHGGIRVANATLWVRVP